MADDDRTMTGEGAQADDDAWLAALAGRDAPDAGASTRDAARLRGAMLRWAPRVDDVAARDPARLARLIAHARRAGLLADAARDRRPPRFVDRLRGWWSAGSAMGMRPVLATAVLAVIVGGGLLMRPAGDVDPPVEVERAGDAVTLLRAADPEAQRRAIVDALAARGVRATTYLRFGRFGLDADLPQPLDADLKAVLERFHLPVPLDGVLRVEVEAARR